MNASVFSESTEMEPRAWPVPKLALQRLRHHLGRAGADDEAWQASLLYGAPWDGLERLVRYWREEFSFDQQPLFRLPCYELSLLGEDVRFVRLRSSQRSALPLLLLHGYSGSPAEFQQLFGALSEPGQYGDDARDAFDVICPCLPGFGSSAGAPDVGHAAETCAALMRALGYSRYVVHGSDLGANIALELGARDREHVVALHVTALPAYPTGAPEETLSLNELEKSQLACIAERHQQLCGALPESPSEGLAFALAQLADSPDCYADAAVQSALLTSWCLAWALGDHDVSSRNHLYRSARLAPAPASSVPVALHDFPLDAPSLRRFAERRHNVLEWQEHARGGCVPGLEQPRVLLESLRAFFRRWR